MSSAGAGGKPSRSAIVADTESGRHLLTIHGYFRTKGIPCVKSSPFTICGHRWRIDYDLTRARARINLVLAIYIE
jgi:hypothetical protein